MELYAGLDLMSEEFEKSCIKEILSRIVSGGGFSLHKNGNYRPDATAWAILALVNYEKETDAVNQARFRLEKGQDKDGRLSLQKDLSAAFWVTPLASLAWHGEPSFKKAYDHSVNFLLSTSGHSFPKESYLGHDTTLRGWPWIEGTHSWIEPTSLACLALEKADKKDNNRFTEAIHLILDRQLSGGGWNFGNTTVFGQELRQTPYSTGMALYALAGNTDRKNIEKSIAYLNKKVKTDRAPLSLGWEILGLSAWDEHNDLFNDYILESWNLQKKYGKYNTTFLSIILLAYMASSKHKKPL